MRITRECTMPVGPLCYAWSDNGLGAMLGEERRTTEERADELRRSRGELESARREARRARGRVDAAKDAASGVPRKCEAIERDG